MKKNVEEFCNEAHWGTYEDVLWAQENGGVILNIEETGCTGWACANDPQCQGHLQIQVFFPAEECSRIITLSGEDIDRFAEAEALPDRSFVVLACDCGHRDASKNAVENFRCSFAGQPTPKCPQCGKRMGALVLCSGCGNYVSLDGVHKDRESGGVTHTCNCRHDVPTGNLGDQYGATGWCKKCAGTEQ